MSRNRIPRRRQRKLKQQVQEGLEKKWRKQAEWRKRQQQLGNGVKRAS